ncbi:MAG: protein kinase [Myxococcota bacterium]|nr:protein kinase [Myxococcota bacterium]
MKIGRYEIVKTLAEGDRGKLYLAKAGGFGGFARHVVIKTFEHLPGAAEGLFIEETLNLGRLHHQHITPILDVGRDADRFYVAIDFVNGRSAREVWQQTFTIGALLPFDFAITVVAAAASGLHYAHTRRTDGGPLALVHGHVSLSNVLIGFDGSVQLIGFAGASARGLRASETQLGFAKDQLAYLAPEQARRQGLDARSDIFALGVVLYELTTMRRAFRDDSDRLTIERVKIGTYVKPREIMPSFPVELERVIARALHIDRDTRYQDAETFRRELVAVGHHLGLVSGDAPIVEVMAQLFEDSTVDPWTNVAPDTTTDDLRPERPNTEPRRPLRAATETVDALAIEMEIPVEGARAMTADDTRATVPIPVLPAKKSDIETDGVPVLTKLPTPAQRPPTPNEVKPRPAPRRRIDPRILAAAIALATIVVTTVVVFAIRGCSTTPPTKPIDAAPVVVIDAAPIDAPEAVVAIDAAPPDASTTVRLQITSTPPNATVLLDGKRLGKTPFEGVVDRADGKHVIKIRLGNHVTAKLEVELTGDITQDVVLVKAASAEEPD